MQQMNCNTLLSALARADSVLLLCHVSPDGDALGSVLALRGLLKAMGKTVRVMVDGEVPSKLSFLPEVNEFLVPENTPFTPTDLAVAVDVSCLERLGSGIAHFKHAKQTACIDHHYTNDGFADVNLIDGNQPATAILIGKLFEVAQIPLSQADAICLYTALSTDTGNFMYESVNSDAFLLMAKLMEAQLPLAKYCNILFREREEIFLRVLRYALSTLQVLDDGRVAGMVLTRVQMDEVGANAGHLDGIVNYAIDIEGVGLGYFLRETLDGKIKGSLRAIAPYRVDEVAISLGGGGHQLACGFTLDMPLKEAEKKVQLALIEARKKIDEKQ